MTLSYFYIFHKSDILTDCWISAWFAKPEHGAILSCITGRGTWGVQRPGIIETINSGHTGTVTLVSERHIATLRHSHNVQSALEVPKQGRAGCGQVFPFTFCHKSSSRGNYSYSSPETLFRFDGNYSWSTWSMVLIPPIMLIADDVSWRWLVEFHDIWWNDEVSKV